MNRRTVLKFMGASMAVGCAGSASARRPGSGAVDERLEKLGHSLLSDPPGGYAEQEIRADGRYGVVGSYFGRGGSFLVDLSDPSNPTQVHRVPSGEDTRNADVKFDPRFDVYYRSQETTGGTGDAGVEVVSYGFGDATPESPEIVADLDNGPTHNVYPHPNAPVLYAVNAHTGTPGFDVVDVSDPAAPEVVKRAGLQGGLHDVVVDPRRELMHAAYISSAEGDAGFAGYAVFDVSRATEPEPLGTFDYATAPNYDEVGEPGFDNCHFATYDPDRMLAYVGDEVGTGVPGGKHVFDIGYGEGSLDDPLPVGFTHSPHAEPQDQPNELFDWTTHNHTIVSRGDTTLMVSGDYREGVVLYDVTDPRNPVAVDWYATDDDYTQAKPPIFPTGRPPMCWGANYSEERDLVFASDMYTGVYTFRILPQNERPGRAAGRGSRTDPGRGP